MLNKSYRSLLLYNAVLPSYDKKTENAGKNDIINASDPKNKDKVHKIMFG